MRFSRVMTRLLVGYFLSHLVLVAMLGGVVSQSIAASLLQARRDRMSTLASALRQHVAELPEGVADPSLIQHFEILGRETGFRLTLIRSNGSVSVDSEKGIDDIGPHGHRTEITEARRAGVGFAERYSSTLGTDMVYFALRIPIGGLPASDIAFIRVANPAESIWGPVRSNQLRWWMLLLSLSCVALVAMTLWIFWVLRPFHECLRAAKLMSAGEFDSVPNLIERRDEWGTLADSFRFLQSTLFKRELSTLDYREKMETVLASMKEGIIALDGEDQILLANSAASLILNLNSIRLAERKLFDFVRVPELSRAIDQTRFQQSFSLVEFESTHLPRRTVSARVTPMLGSGLSTTADVESTPGVVIVLSDVTEMRQLESVRQDFVANVSHELKTPLASIKAYAETLRLGALFDQEKNMEFVTQIESQADLLHRQIEDLLQLARVESGDQNWDIHSVALNQACNAAIEQFQSQALPRGVALAAQLDARGPTVQADGDAIRIVLNNLVSNALRYTRSGGKIILETTREDGYGVVRVIDTGIGIAPEHHARIFERFYRVDRARSRDLGGTGLGLAIVKHFVQGFGGRVELSSQVDQGSTFSVWLPLS